MLPLRTSMLGSHEIAYCNEIEFGKIREEVYELKEYFFESEVERPFIIDCGAHVGVATLYFKQLYEKAKILAVEPDPRNSSILAHNVARNRLTDVHIVQAAAWTTKGVSAIYYDQEMHKDQVFTWGNTLIENMWGETISQAFAPTICLSDYITQPVDFLKIDIEGSEEIVIREISPRLSRVRQIVVECHETNTNEDINKLDRIIDMLEMSHFQLDVQLKSIDGLFTCAQREQFNPRLTTIRGVNKTT